MGEGEGEGDTYVAWEHGTRDLAAFGLRAGGDAVQQVVAEVDALGVLDDLEQGSVDERREEVGDVELGGFGALELPEGFFGESFADAVGDLKSRVLGGYWMIGDGGDGERVRRGWRECWEQG